jgi:hydrogenase maturation protein HypF
MTELESTTRLRVIIRGAVQGVGFRPFVYLAAVARGLAGYVTNTTEGVELEAEGPRPALEDFLEVLRRDPPPLSIIESVEAVWLPPGGAGPFEIRTSETVGELAAYILPDIATCPACIREIFDPQDRRHRYPFTNCTHCGPRFTIINSLPYDRVNTSMRGFAMCPACRAEYDDPRDRRFHAQPTACPDCGPQLALWDATGETLAVRDAALRDAALALRSGRVVAVKGLGGFHLMVDARDDPAVRRLRTHKHREEKPFALMYPSLDDIRRDCEVSELEARLLTSPECPIVLMKRRSGGDALAASVAPGAPRFGAMLPCTPLHHLLLTELGFPVVATSGNLSEEPICIDEREALLRLRGIADVFLVHNRPIVRHVDDSIVHVAAGREMVLRRARGYAPLPVSVGETGPVVLALGGHLKNTVALAKRGQIFLSQHIGDLETPRAFDAFLEAADALITLYDARPQRVACDQHPDYLSARHGRALRLPFDEVQHHYAHVLACMAEHRLEGPVLGVAWDGTGYGPDGTIWGGEFLRATREGYERTAHLATFPLPGGDLAAREPRRAALGLLYTLYGERAIGMQDLAPIRAFTPEELKVLVRTLDRGVNAPRTSSAGRLFDAAAALLDLRQRSAYEGQAAMLLEYAARRATGRPRIYPPAWRSSESGGIIDWEPIVQAILDDLACGVPAPDIAAGFHASLAQAIVEAAQRAGLETVVLTGGCFQNVLLTELSVDRLRSHGFDPVWHHRVPPNDGGIAVGQALYALRRGQKPEDRVP